LAPDGLEDPRPGVADADVARRAAAGRDLVAVLVVDDRVDTQDTRPAAARLHRLQRRQRAAQETAVLGLPPGIHDGRLALADLGHAPVGVAGVDVLVVLRRAGHIGQVAAG